MNTKNKTKRLVLLAIIAFATTIFSSCIPSGYGNIDPKNPTDTSIQYFKPNAIILHYTKNSQEQFKSYDFDKDGIKDYEFYSFGSPVIGGDLSYIKGLNENQVILKSNISNLENKYFKAGDLINTNNYIINTSYFDVFDVKLANIPYIYTDLIGFRIKQNGLYHYGWMQLRRTVIYSELILILAVQYAMDVKIELLSYGYKKLPNISIQAGKY